MTVKELLEKFLNGIDYKLVHRGCDHHEIVNQKGESTGYTIWQTEIEHGFDGGVTVFPISEETIKQQSKNCVCINNGDGKGKDGFMLFINHDMKE